MVWLDLVSEG